MAKANETAKAKTTETREAKVLRWINDHAEWAREGFEGKKAEMIQAIETNPADAIHWRSDEMVAEQTRYELWNRVRIDLEAAMPIREVLAWHERDAYDRVGGTLGGGSTNAFDRAVERTRGETLYREIRKLREFATALDGQE
jgi:hypothetical protein